MPYIHSVRCPTNHNWVEVCTRDEDGYEMGTVFRFTCPSCEKEHFLTTAAVEILDEGEPCPEGTVPGELITGEQLGELKRAV